MSRVTAINWHPDGWMEVEGALTVEAGAEVQVSLFLPADPKQPKSKVVAVWDGRTCHRVEVVRGVLSRLPPWPAREEPLRLHVFCAFREAGGNDARRLGVLLRLATPTEAKVDRRLDIAAPGRGFLPHPDRALVAEFMNLPVYCAGFPPREVPSDPVLHYLVLGGATGRDPAPGFRSAEHLAATPGLAESGANPFVHFLRETLGEGAADDPGERQPQAVQALRRRLAGLPEEAAAPAAAAVHSGLHEANAHLAVGNRAEAFGLALSALLSGDRAAAAAAMLSQIVGTTDGWDRVEAAMEALFDPLFYVARNGPLPGEGTEAEVHYLLHGWREGRQPSALFDPAFYAAQLPGGLPEGAFPLAHFLDIGQAAGLRGVAEGSAAWPTPPVPGPADWEGLVPPAGDAAATVIVLAGPGDADPRATVLALLRGRTGADHAVAVVDASDGAEWSADLEMLGDQGLVIWRRAPAEVPAAAVLRDLLGGMDPSRAAVVMAPDARPCPGWFDRLSAHAAPDVATVTALSTHAEFGAYPRPGAANLVACETPAEEIDRIAAEVNAGQAVEVPGAGGACVLITPQALQRLAQVPGSADPVAGTGRAARRAGLRNLLACNVFVPRTGPAVPRLPADPEAAAAGDALRLAAVRAHLRADPLRPARRRIDLGRLGGQGGTTVLHITHGMGGGVETHVAQALRQVPGSAVLRLHDGVRLTVATDPRTGAFVPNLAGVDLRADGAALAAAVAALAPGRVVVHSLAGLVWPVQERALQVLARLRTETVFVAHDYAAISAQYCLAAPDGLPWRGPPRLPDLQAWAEMTDPMAETGQGDPEERQATWSMFLARVGRRIAPSAAAAAIFSVYFPSLAFEVVPHPPHLPALAPVAPRKPDGRLRVAVPGKIWPHKGSRVLEALAAEVRARSLPVDLHVVGHSDIDDRLKALGVRITGAYRREAEAVDHLRRLAPDVVLVPSLWPETYCYTLDFAPALGLRAAVFDLGAQAERARGMAGAAVLPLALAEDPAGLAAALMAMMPQVAPVAAAG